MPTNRRIIFSDELAKSCQNRMWGSRYLMLVSFGLLDVGDALRLFFWHTYLLPSERFGWHTHTTLSSKRSLMKARN